MVFDALELLEKLKTITDATEAKTEIANALGITPTLFSGEGTFTWSISIRYCRDRELQRRLHHILGLLNIVIFVFEFLEKVVDTDLTTLPHCCEYENTAIFMFTIKYNFTDD